MWDLWTLLRIELDEMDVGPGQIVPLRPVLMRPQVTPHGLDEICEALAWAKRADLVILGPGGPVPATLALTDNGYTQILDMQCPARQPWMPNFRRSLPVGSGVRDSPTGERSGVHTGRQAGSPPWRRFSSKR